MIKVEKSGEGVLVRKRELFGNLGKRLIYHIPETELDRITRSGVIQKIWKWILTGLFLTYVSCVLQGRRSWDCRWPRRCSWTSASGGPARSPGPCWSCVRRTTPWTSSSWACCRSPTAWSGWGILAGENRRFVIVNWNLYYTLWNITTSYSFISLLQKGNSSNPASALLLLLAALFLNIHFLSSFKYPSSFLGPNLR